MESTDILKISVFFIVCFSAKAFPPSCDTTPQSAASCHRVERPTHPHLQIVAILNRLLERARIVMSDLRRAVTPA